MIERLRLHLQDLLNTVNTSTENNFSWAKDDRLAYDVAMLTANIAVGDMGLQFIQYSDEILVIEKY